MLPPNQGKKRLKCTQKTTKLWRKCSEINTVNSGHIYISDSNTKLHMALVGDIFLMIANSFCKNVEYIVRLWKEV